MSFFLPTVKNALLLVAGVGWLVATTLPAIGQTAAPAPASSSASAAPVGDASTPTPTLSPSADSLGGPSEPSTDFGTSLHPVSPSAEIGTGAATPQNYPLGPGDTVSVHVQPQNKYSASGVLVTQDGYVDYPVIGRIQASGKTAEQLSQDIAAKLGDYCINPDVTVTVVSLHPEVVYVTGGATTQRALDIHAAPNLLKALTLAGGVTDRDSLSHLAVVRGQQILHADLYPLWVQGIDNGQNLALEPGDTIIVPVNTARVTVVGAVGTPGIQPLEMSSDSSDGPERLSDALAKAGSPVRQHGARIGQVAILRHVTPDGKADITKYDFGKFLKTGDVADNPVLRDNDLIVVPEENHPVSAGSILNFVPFYYLFQGILR